MVGNRAPLLKQASVRAVSAVESGMVFMAAGSLIVPITHAIAKFLGGSMAPAQISLARFVFQFLLLLPIIWIGRRGRLPPPTRAHALRGILVAAATLFFFWSLIHMPLADSSAIFFVEPLLLTLMAALFLGDAIGYRRATAVVFGFCGALIVIRPSFHDIGAPALLPLLSALCIAIYIVITRRLAGREDPRVMQFWVCFFAALTLAAAILIGTQTSWTVLHPTWPTATEWGLLVAMGIIATIAHMLAILSIQRAPVTVLAPLQYLEILAATVLGIMLFSDMPDAMTLSGIVLIVGSGLYVFHRERQASNLTEESA